MYAKIASLVVVAAALCGASEARVMGQCEFANTIRGLGFPADQIGTWTCIANFESHYDTDAYNSNTGDHGIFQISQIYWCSTGDQPGGGCNARCSDFHNDDISDDGVCVRAIWAEHQRLTGDGFNAWTTYGNCKGDTSGWIAGC